MGDEKMKKTTKTIQIGNRRVTLLAAVMALVLCLAIGGTIAYLLTSTAMVQNTFIPGNVDVEVNSNDQIVYKGNTDAYIRITVTALWMKNNQVHGEHVPDWDMELTSDWVKVTQDGQDFYYYNKVVHKGDGPITIFTAAPHLTNNSHAAPESGFIFTYQIGAQSIQTQPQDALDDANWQYTPSGN